MTDIARRYLLLKILQTKYFHEDGRTFLNKNTKNTI